MRKTIRRFVIHEHKAKKAGKHYDFRVENKYNSLDSYATKKEIFEVTEDNKIMLFEQPKHKKKWLLADGVIVDGYGKGEISIKDYGKAIELVYNEKMRIYKLYGDKIKGVYVLLNVGKDEWLFFKSKKKY